MYDVEVIEMLTHVFSSFFTRPGMEAYIVATKRNEKTMQFFEDNISKRGLKLESVTDQFSIKQIFDYERTNISIIKITSTK